MSAPTIPNRVATGWPIPASTLPTIHASDPSARTPAQCHHCGSRMIGDPPPRIVRTGPLEVDLNARRALVDGVEIAYSQREWDLLAYLAERIGCWCPNVEIVRAVWGPEWLSAAPYGHQRGRRDDHLLCIAVGRLRRKLGPAGRLLTAHAGRKRLLLEAVQ